MMFVFIQNEGRFGGGGRGGEFRIYERELKSCSSEN